MILFLRREKSIPPELRFAEMAQKEDPMEGWSALATVRRCLSMQITIFSLPSGQTVARTPSDADWQASVGQTQESPLEIHADAVTWEDFSSRA